MLELQLDELDGVVQVLVRNSARAARPPRWAAI